MSLSRGQLKSGMMEERFLRKAVKLEIRAGRTKSQILSAFVESARGRVASLYDELAFTCDKCFMPYLRKSDLTNHLRINHGRQG